MLYEYLKENYIPGEPIFTGDIDIPGMTEENLRYHLKKLTDSGTICRFEPGVYYFPKTDIFGERMSLSPDTVAVHKYIMRRGKRVGYYSGYTLANRMGLSTQVPFTQEISSNFAPALVRKIKIKNRHANSHFPRPAGPHFPSSQGHIKRSALEIGRARGAPPC